MKGIRCLWHSCLWTGLLSGAVLAADTGATNSPARAITLEEFKAQVEAEKARATSARTQASRRAAVEQRARGAAAAQQTGSTGRVMTVDEFIASLGEKTTDTAPVAPRATDSPATDPQLTDSLENTENNTESEAPANIEQITNLADAGAGFSTDSSEAAPVPEEPATPAPAPAPTPAAIIAQPVVVPAETASNNDVAQLLAVARSGGILDVRTAVRQAMQTHPSIAESMGMLYSTLEEVEAARAGYFPRVSSAIGSGYRRSNSDPWDSFNISASQMLYDFGKVSSSVDAASSNAERNRAGVLLTMDDLARDTAEAFIEVQRYQALMEIAKEQTAAISDIQSLAEQRSQLGASTRSDALQALSRHEAALATELQLQAQLDMWKRTLQNYIGREVPARIDAAFPPAFDQACVANEDDFANVPRVLAAEAKLAEARARIERAKADFFPTFTLNANYGNLNNPQNVAFNPVLNSREFSVALSVDSTLYQGGGATARRRAAEYSVQAAQAGKQAALLEVTRSFREARDQSLSYTERLRYLDNRYENVLNTQELYRQQYLSLGTRTLLDILNTEQEIHQSRFDAQHTVHDLRQMQIVCLHSLGKLRDAFGIDSSIARGDEL